MPWFNRNSEKQNSGRAVFYFKRFAVVSRLISHEQQHGISPQPSWVLFPASSNSARCGWRFFLYYSEFCSAAVSLCDAAPAQPKRLPHNVRAGPFRNASADYSRWASRAGRVEAHRWCHSSSSGKEYWGQSLREGASMMALRASIPPPEDGSAMRIFWDVLNTYLSQ